MHRNMPERFGPPEPPPEVIERSIEYSRRQKTHFTESRGDGTIGELNAPETIAAQESLAPTVGSTVMEVAMPAEAISPIDETVDAERRSSPESSFRVKMIEVLTPVVYKLGEAYEAARMSEQKQTGLLNDLSEVRQTLDNGNFGYNSGDPLTLISQLEARLDKWADDIRIMAEQAGEVVQSGRFIKGKFDEVGGRVEDEKREKNSTGLDNQSEGGDTLSFELSDDQAGEQTSAETEKNERDVIDEADNLLVDGAYDAVIALGSDSIEISLQGLPRRLEGIREIIVYMYGDYRTVGARSLENNLPDLKSRLNSFIQDLESTRVATSQKKVALEGLSQHVASILENLKAGESSES